jgi:hypothetical protein
MEMIESRRCPAQGGHDVKLVIARSKRDEAIQRRVFHLALAADGGRRHAAEGGTEIGVDPASGDVPCNCRTAAIRAATESVDDSP